jgi:hypothetical protein
MRIGTAFGIYVLHPRPNICYGGFVKGAYQLVFVYKTNGYLVHYHVLFVIIVMKMIYMCFLSVKRVLLHDKLQVWTPLFFLGYNRYIAHVKLFFRFALLLMLTQQGCLL